MMKSLPCFAGSGGAREFAERLAKELASGSQVPALTPAEARDALAVRDALAAFRKETGLVISPIQAVTEYLAAARKLGDRQLSEAVAGFLGTVATVKIVDLAEAVTEFNTMREAKTQAKAGERAQLSSHHVYMTALWIGWFGKAFPGTAICDLRKDHMTLFMQSYAHLSAKSRNHLRGAIRHFLAWCVKRDYLSQSHRLAEAPGMENETVTSGDTDFHRPGELRKLLDDADENMRPIIALQALAGLRQAEALRLTWQDVFGTPGHITISASKSKTRSRRLVEMVPALAQWLEVYRQNEGPLWSQSEDTYQETFAALRESLRIPARRNGLRHAFCSFHFALHANENLTAQQAGNSPQQIHSHYKGFATKADAEAWFAVAPAPVAANVVSISQAVA
jgi:integrase